MPSPPQLTDIAPSIGKSYPYIMPPIAASLVRFGRWLAAIEPQTTSSIACNFNQ
jgi:hypothetical protein